ncbi:MAG: hypothetical protein MI919_38510, partial [Holophagales bacterium]|nr:hypothetical protein [Holophagales bacterium]
MQDSIKKLVDEKRFDEALEAIRAALEGRPENRRLRGLKKRAEAGAAREKRIGGWLEKAQATFEAGRSEETKRLLDRIYEEDPGHQGALELLLQVEERESDLPLDEVKETAPLPSPADELRGEILGLLEQLRINDARWALEQALAVSEGQELAELADRVRRAELREERLLERLDPSALALEAGELEEAERRLGELTDEEARHPEALRLANRLEELREVLGKAEWQRIEKRDEVANEAESFLEAGCFPQARQRLRVVEELDPDWPRVESLRRLLHEKEDRVSRQIERLKAALEVGEAETAREAYEALEA